MHIVITDLSRKCYWYCKFSANKHTSACFPPPPPTHTHTHTLQLWWRTPPSRSGWRCPTSPPQSTWTPPSTPQRWVSAVWAAGKESNRCCPQPSKSHWTLRGVSRYVLLRCLFLFSGWCKFEIKRCMILPILLGVPGRPPTSRCHHATLHDADQSQLARAGEKQYKETKVRSESSQYLCVFKNSS